MARASTRVWVGMAVSLAVTPLLVDWSGSIGRAQQSMSRAHSVLNTAIDCYRRGDYALADSFFQQAQTMQEDLTPAEKAELASEIVGARSEIANLESQLAQEAANARALSEANQILVDHANSADKRIVELQSDAAQAREKLLLVENDKRSLQTALD